MQLEDTFTVPVPVETVWDALLDVERIAPCMPGASVDRVDGDDVHGGVKIKLGPIMMRYQGVLTLVEKDEATRHTVMTARAKEARGGGAVTAAISATLVEVGGGTEVRVVTDLDITGKAAQFGRGVMADVSRRLMAQFADNLARELTSASTAPVDSGERPATASGTAGAPVAAAGATAGAGAQTASEGGDSLDLLALIKEPAKQQLPVLVALILGVLLGRAIWRRR